MRQRGSSGVTADCIRSSCGGVSVCRAGVTLSALMSDGMCTAMSSLTVRVTIDVEVAVGHGMVTRRVSEEAAE